MTFQPFVPVGGLAGWRFLQSTLETQKAAFAKGPILQRDLDDFAARIGTVRTAEALVSDYRLLSVALGAFGLSEDLPNKFFIRKVLEGGTEKPDALANRLADKRYRDMARAFGFGDRDPPNTVLTDFPGRIADRFRDIAFETALGRSDETMRLALFARREMAVIAASDVSDTTKWFQMMGTPPLRKALEGAFGLPTSFGALDLDRQLKTFRSRAEQGFGAATFDALAEPATLERVLDRFTARAGLSLQSSVTSPALMILRGY